MQRANKNWTKEEDEFLREYSGTYAVHRISKELNRSCKAIIARIEKYKLSVYKKGDYLAGNEVARMLGLNDIRPLQKKGLPLFKRKFYKCSYNVINVDSLMKWLKNNQDKWNASLTEPYGLPEEPAWLTEKRRADKSKPKQGIRWTEEEEKTLKKLYLCDIEFIDIAKRLQRTEQAIQRKVSSLKEKRLLPMKKINIRWKKEEIQRMLELQDEGLTDKEIAYHLGREKDHIVDKRRRLVRDGITKNKINRAS